MLTNEWAPLIQALTQLILVVVIPWGVWEFRKRTGLEATDQQRRAMTTAAETVTGLVQTKLDTGELKIADIAPENPTIHRLAAEAIERLPVATAGAEKMIGSDELAIIAASRVNTTPPAPPLIVAPLAVPSEPSH